MSNQTAIGARKQLLGWWFQQKQNSTGPINPELWQRVGEALKQDDTTGLHIALWIEVQGGIAGKQAKKSGKPGRRGYSPKELLELLSEFEYGEANGHWKDQAEFARRKRKTSAWASKLLNRARELKKR